MKTIIKLLVLNLILISSNLSFISFAQDKTDYQIYVTVLSNRFNKWNVNIDTVKRIIISSKSNFSEIDYSSINSTINEILNGNEQDLFFYARNDLNSYKSFKNDTVKNLLKDFKAIKNISVELKNDGFEGHSNFEIINSSEIDKIFKGHYYDKQWKRFNKKYTNSHGYYQFSLIANSSEFAVLYYIRESAPLSADGNLVALRKIDGKWTVIFSLYLWQS